MDHLGIYNCRAVNEVLLEFHLFPYNFYIFDSMKVSLELFQVKTSFLPSDVKVTNITTSYILDYIFFVLNHLAMAAFVSNDLKLWLVFSRKIKLMFP